MLLLGYRGRKCIVKLVEDLHRIGGGTGTEVHIGRRKSGRDQVKGGIVDV